eukprot:1433999-Amphidinium_carterae.2
MHQRDRTSWTTLSHNTLFYISFNMVVEHPVVTTQQTTWDLGGKYGGNGDNIQCIYDDITMTRNIFSMIGHRQQESGSGCGLQSVPPDRDERREA